MLLSNSIIITKENHLCGNARTLTSPHTEFNTEDGSLSSIKQQIYKIESHKFTSRQNQLP